MYCVHTWGLFKPCLELHSFSQQILDLKEQKDTHIKKKKKKISVFLTIAKALPNPCQEPAALTAREGWISLMTTWKSAAFSVRCLPPTPTPAQSASVRGSGRQGTDTFTNQSQSGEGKSIDIYYQDTFLSGCNTVSLLIMTFTECRG